MIKYIDTNKIEIPEGFFNDLNVPKFFQWLNDLPTADVEEVRQGEWKHVKTLPMRGPIYQCTNCKEEYNEQALSMKRCPECGAKMDRKEQK